MAPIRKRRMRQNTLSCQSSVTSTCDTQFNTEGELGKGRWGYVYEVKFPSGKYKGLRALKRLKEELKVCRIRV